MFRRASSALVVFWAASVAAEAGLKTDIEFAKAGSVSLTLDAWTPDGPGPFAAVIVVHGGGFVAGDKQTYVQPLFEPLTKGGFAWFTINYRLAPQHPFPAATKDVERAILWVKQHAAEYKVDPNRIALVGESAGGHLVSYVGAKHNSAARVAAVVSFYGPHDLVARARAQNGLNDNLKKFLQLGELNDAAIRKMTEASPITHVSGGMPPYLLIHGTKDPSVPYDQSVRMCERMKQAGASCEIFTVEGGGHGVGNWEKTPAYHTYKPRMIAWLQQRLQTRPVDSRLDRFKKDAVVEIDKLRTLTQQMVDSIFSFAELGFHEYETTRYVTGILEKNGFRVERGVAGMPTAWVATYGSGKPVIAFITDIDGIPQASQKPGVADHDPLVKGAPGHGEGHNSGMAVNVTAAIVLKQLMEKHGITGTLKLFPGVAEELLGAKAFFVRAGLFRDVDIVLGSHVDNEFATSYGQGERNSGLVSVQYTFHGRAAHSAGAPWAGRSALDAVELMNTAWNFRREHLRTEQRSHYVITNGGDQPNVVPSEATVWYYFRELDYPRIREMLELGNTMAKAAAMQTGTTMTQRMVGSAWPQHFNKVVAETQQNNIDAVGMPEWSDDDQTLAKALQKEVDAREKNGLKHKVNPLEEPKTPRGGGTDDIADISWNAPTVYMRFPANIPGLAGHSWMNAVSMATPIAHKGSTAGAKVQAMTALDFLLEPQLVDQAWKYFREVQTKDVKYQPLISETDQPAIDLNKEKMEKFAPELRKYHYDPARYKTYLEQLGIKYPTVR